MRTDVRATGGSKARTEHDTINMTQHWKADQRLPIYIVMATLVGIGSFVAPGRVSAEQKGPKTKTVAAAAFSVRLPKTDARGRFGEGSLVPGGYRLTRKGVRVKTQVREGEAAQPAIRLGALKP